MEMEMSNSGFLIVIRRAGRIKEPTPELVVPLTRLTEMVLLS